jgi:predicted dehydrogenase
MGVYGIHEITGLLGPARRVTAFTGITEPERIVRGGPFKGKRIRVTEDDNVLALLDFGGSTFAVVDGTFNVHASKGPKIEIFGREGTLNLYKTGSPLLEIYRQDVADGLDGWVVPEPWPASNNARFDLLHRGLLIDHLADVVAGEQDLVLSAEHARHALEIMIAIKQSSREGRAIELTTTF